MSERIVSAEEAWKLLEGATPGTWIDFGDKEPYPGEVVCYGDADNGRLTRICRDPDMDDRPGDRRLIAAAPDLAHTVARLQDLLAAERGERAPEGWEWDAACQVWRDSTHAYYVRRVEVGTWCWDGEGHEWGRADTALEAIEAADRAAKVNP